MSLPTIDSTPLKQAITDALETQRTHLPTAAGTRLRGSYALACDRRIAYEILETPKDFEPDGGALAAFHVGHSWHTVIQQALVDLHGAELEVEIDLRPDWDMSTHADGIYPDTSVEIKSKSEWAFNRFVNGMKSNWAKEPSEPVGPDEPDVVQATFSAIGAGCDWVHIIYVNKNKPSEIAEWVFDIDEPLTHLGGASARGLAVADLVRMTSVLDRVSEMTLPARDVPGHGRIGRVPRHVQVSPKAKGCWKCRYCPFNETCRSMPEGAVSLADLGGAA